MQKPQTYPILFGILPFLSLKHTADIIVGSVLNQECVQVLRFLRDSSLSQYKVLSAISVVYYPDRFNRFEVVYELLSIKLNNRFRLKTYVNESTPVQSSVGLYPCANWWEREGWDLFWGFLFGTP